MIGDVKFHEHKDIDSNVADRWKQYYTDDFLGDITWQAADALGYEGRSPLNRTFEVSDTLSTQGGLQPIQPIPRASIRRKNTEQLLAQLDQLSEEEVDALLDDLSDEEESNG